MTHPFPLMTALGLALCLSACGEPIQDAAQDSQTRSPEVASEASVAEAAPTADASPQISNAKAPEPVTETLIWDDLLPKNEDQVLAELYAEFYEEQEKQFREQLTLPQAANAQDDLMSLIDEGSAQDTMIQIGTFNVVEDLDGKHIRIPGYVVPFDFSAEAKHKEFLLVPYFGACLHTPPPPPNQIIFVTSDPAATLEDIFGPVWVEGTLKTGEYLNDLGNSAYELSLSKIESYEY